jgi:choice-of-anchor A domain-containing protein/uncharacterized repeat protein (TIGR01451 family)
MAWPVRCAAALVAAATLAGASALPGAASPARAQADGTAADRPARSSAANPDPFNPVTGNRGFAVFVQGNAALNATASSGPVALGGNLTFGPASFSVATQTAGTFTAPGDAKPTGLLVGGSINWAASSSTGNVNVLSSSYVKIGDMTGSAVAQSGSAPMRIVPAGHTYGSSPQIADMVNQPTSSVNQSGLINFNSAFTTFAGQSAGLATCASTLALTSANGTPLTLPLSPGTNAYVTLTAGTQNVLDISAANLANINSLQFRNDPAATMPLIINVDTTGAGNNFSWSPPNINGPASASAGYMLWNFPTATQLTFDGSQTVPGTIYAPRATFNEYELNGLNGGVIAAAYAQGGPGGSPNGGQVLSTPFATTVTGCATPQLTISLRASTGTAVPGGTVKYKVSVTNSGSVAYTGATFTDSLSGVLDDASFNGDAVASAGSVAFSSPNLSWTGNLAVGATATITFSVTVNSPDTRNKILASVVTSTTAGGNCASGSTDPRCVSTVTVLVPALTIVNSAGVSSTTPGSTVRFTVTITNTGQTAYPGIAVADSLSGLTGQTPYTAATVTDSLADVAYNGDAAATSGSVSYAAPVLTWTGDLAPGDTTTIKYSVRVNNHDTGSRVLTNTATSSVPGSTCPPAAPRPGCTATVLIMSGPLSITAPAAAFLGSAVTGGTISGSLGKVQITDDRGLGAGWTVTVSATDFTTGNGTLAETIPVSDASYSITGFTQTSGPATFTAVPAITLAAGMQAVVTATSVGGNDSAAWDPLIDVSVPSDAVAGSYTATITESVS